MQGSETAAGRETEGREEIRTERENRGTQSPGLPRASSTSPRRLPVRRSTNVIRFPPSSVRWLSALPMMNMSGRSTEAHGPEVTTIDMSHERSAVSSFWRLTIFRMVMTEIFPRPPCCRNSLLSMLPW